MTERNQGNAEIFRTMMAKLREDFLSGLPERLDQMDSLLLALEKGVEPEESYNELYRVAHSLKGSGGTHGLHIISTICHQMEDHLKSIAGHLNMPAEAFVSGGLAHVDLLRDVVKEARRGKDDFPDIEKKLSALRSKVFSREFAVLLVDNSRLSTNILTQALADLPIRLVVMNDGYAALLRVLAEPFDILITALELPVLNGRALIGALRLSSSHNRRIKTILVSSSQEIKNQLKRATDADYLVTKDAKIAHNVRDLVARIAEELRSNQDPASNPR